MTFGGFQSLTHPELTSERHSNKSPKRIFFLQALQNDVKRLEDEAVGINIQIRGTGILHVCPWD